MARTRRQALLVFVLPLAVAVGVTSLLELRYGAARSSADATAPVTPGAAEVVELLYVQDLLAHVAAPAPLDPALSSPSVSIDALMSERSRGGAPEQPLPIPEPSSGLLLALGLAGLAARRCALPRA